MVRYGFTLGINSMLIPIMSIYYKLLCFLFVNNNSAIYVIFFFAIYLFICHGFCLLFIIKYIAFFSTEAIAMPHLLIDP